MGSTPSCLCFQKKNQLIIDSEIIFQNFEDYMENINKEKRDSRNSIINKKSEIDNYKNTLSIRNDFINPLPEIVVIRYKNL